MAWPLSSAAAGLSVQASLKTKPLLAAKPKKVSTAAQPQASLRGKEGRRVLRGTQRMKVTATAYNSLRGQTDSTPNHGAWGDRLSKLPRGVRAAAVSPDLLCRGFGRHQRFRIKGQKGEFEVLDVTAARWRKRVDVHMGKNLRAARRFGRRNVEISWRGPLVRPAQAIHSCLSKARKREIRERKLSKKRRLNAKHRQKKSRSSRRANQAHATKKLKKPPKKTSKNTRRKR